MGMSYETIAAMLANVEKRSNECIALLKDGEQTPKVQFAIYCLEETKRLNRLILLDPSKEVADASTKRIQELRVELNNFFEDQAQCL